MDLSIVVVTYNSAEHISACLTSLERAIGAIGAEIIVVDNDSKDGTPDVVRRHAGVTLIESGANLGFAGGINAALAVASGRYVAWINPDAVVVEGRFDQAVRWCDQHPSAGIVGLRLVDAFGQVEPSSRGFPSYHSALGHRYSLLTRVWPGNPFSKRYLRTHADRDGTEIVDWVSGAALMHRRALVEQIDGLDERFFMYCEDVDFCYRATLAGWQVHYLPVVTLRHEIGASSSQVKPAMIRARHESLWRYYKKHFTRNPLKDAVTYAGIFGRARALLIYDRLGGRRIK